MPADYRYDVFFSYKRQDPTLPWMREVVAKLRFWLTEDLNRAAEVFVDESSIPIGKRWPDELKQAVKDSRCIVCVWSPSYFQSDWCVSEWQSFVAREKLRDVEPRRLIAPLKFHDGEHFPQEAKETEWEDVAKYAITVPAFWGSPRAIEYEEKLKSFANSVADMVRGAPHFRADWPIVERTGGAPPPVGLAKL